MLSQFKKTLGKLPTLPFCLFTIYTVEGARGGRSLVMLVSVQKPKVIAHLPQNQSPSLITVVHKALNDLRLSFPSLLSTHQPSHCYSHSLGNLPPRLPPGWNAPLHTAWPRPPSPSRLCSNAIFLVMVTVTPAGVTLCKVQTSCPFRAAFSSRDLMIFSP